MNDIRRILFTSHIPFSRSLGATKVQLELGDAMEPLGWHCVYASPADIHVAAAPGATAERQYENALREFLRTKASDFDVVEYHHHHLPFDRRTFHKHTLMVARSVLLIHHFVRIRPPLPRTLRQLARRVIRGPRDRAAVSLRVLAADHTLANADLINVSNRHDRDELVNRGLNAEKITVLPYGLGHDRRSAFDAVAVAPLSRPPRVAFVGSFDYRKGGADMPRIWRRVVGMVSTARLRLIGTRGLFRDADQVLAQFPAAIRSSVEVIPAFAPEDLPRLLADCRAGMFPSYIEGFGIGVLEMLAAGLPVIAYDSPGPPEMLPRAWLVPPGDTEKFAKMLLILLTAEDDDYRAARITARNCSRPFSWDQIARKTDLLYRDRLERIRHTGR